MSSRQPLQYTIRNVSPLLDGLIRQKAKVVGKSLNEVALDALKRGLGMAGEAPLHHDLDKLIGTWQEDKAFDEAIRSQRKIDKDLWK